MIGPVGRAGRDRPWTGGRHYPAQFRGCHRHRPCCLACPHRAVSRAPALVHSRGHLFHCARRDTGRGARPGGLRYTRFRSARPGGCRQPRSASTTLRSAGMCRGGAALPPASPTAPATDARAPLKRSRCRWLGDGAVGAVARCLIDDRLPGTVPGGSFRRWACMSAVAVLKAGNR